MNVGTPTRWVEAHEAVSCLADAITQADPDGISLYFFSHGFDEYFNINNPQRVRELFDQHRPGGSTDLAKVLKVALDRHFKNNTPETILIITDGEPDDQRAVARVITEATKKMARDEDLSLSFIQVGHDTGATKFLKNLDDELPKHGAKFDIVDCVTAEEFEGMGFAALVQKSIVD